MPSLKIKNAEREIEMIYLQKEFKLRLTSDFYHEQLL